MNFKGLKEDVGILKYQGAYQHEIAQLREASVFLTGSYSMAAAASGGHTVFKPAPDAGDRADDLKEKNTAEGPKTN